MVGHTEALPGQMARPMEAPAVPEFEIIPVKAIPLVGIVLAGLVAAILSEKLWPLEFFHVTAGGIWTAVDLFVGLIVGPILGRLSVQARIEFVTSFMPKMVLLMPTLVTCTLVAGWALANQTGDIAVGVPGPLVADGVVHRRRHHVGHRPGHPGAGEPGGAVRAEEAGAQRRAHRQADAALRLHGGHHRPHAGRNADHHDEGRDMVMPNTGRKLPPIAEVAVVTMALVVIGGTFIAGHIPDKVPLLLPTILAIAAAVLLVFNLYQVSTLKQFAWGVFKQVYGWSLVGYGVIAGLLMFVFLRDDIPGDVMTFLIAMLVIFAINIPLLFAFSVARYQPESQ